MKDKMEEFDDEEPEDEGTEDEEGDLDVPLEADRIYVLMKKDYRLSRNSRARWYLRHLFPSSTPSAANRELQGDVFRINKYESINDFRPGDELAAVGVVPKEDAMPSDWDWDVSHLYDYFLTPNSKVRFLSQRYRFAYVLDLSPSAAGINLSLKRDTLVNSLLPALSDSLTGLVRPFYVPGSQLLLQPDVYVTVVAWTPFMTDGAQAVLHQGRLITSANLVGFLDTVSAKLHALEQRLACMSDHVHDHLQAKRSAEDRLVGSLFEEPLDGSASVVVNKHHAGGCGTDVCVTCADVGFVNIIRTGMLALQLLPGNRYDNDDNNEF